MTGEEIRAARRSLGWTQNELAKRVGYSQATISVVERGGKPPSSALLRVLEEALANPRRRSEGEPRAGMRPLALPRIPNPGQDGLSPYRFEVWQRPQQSGDHAALLAFDNHVVLPVAFDIAGHGQELLPLGIYVQGWLRGYLAAGNRPPRLSSLIDELSDELERTRVELAGCFAIFEPSPSESVVRYEVACQGFPPPLLIEGPPFTTAGLSQVGPPLPSPRGSRIVRGSLSAPWRLLMASDGLLKRLGGGDEFQGKRRLLEWQTGPYRDRPLAEHLSGDPPLGDDELLAVLRWERWDIETTFLADDYAQAHQTLEVIGRRVEERRGRSARMKLQQAIVEALENARRHAYLDEAGTVTLRFRAEASWLRVEVEDHGSLEASLQKARKNDGGIEVMRQTTDGVDIRRNRDGGWTVQLRLALES